MAASSTESSATPSLTPSPPLASVGPTPPTESFDDLGDLQLIVGVDSPDQVRFLVCSRALSRASPVLKAMFGGPWLEKRPVNSDVDWVVALPEDEPKYMRLIIALAHASYRKVPQEMERDELYQLCFYIDKYGISECLKPWLEKWCRRVVYTNIAGKDAAKTLWIGWVLGSLDLVERSADGLFEFTKSSEIATLKALDPTGLIGDIQKMQLETARKIVSVVYDFWLALATPSELGDHDTRCVSGLSPATRELCDAATLGNLTASLAREGFLSSKIYDDFDISSLLDSLSEISAANATLQGLGLAHKLCGPRRTARNDRHESLKPLRLSMSEELQKLSESVNVLPHPVSETARKSVAARAKKIGAEGY